VRLTERGWLIVYCVGAVLLIAFMIWADAAIQIEGVDDARVDAEVLQ
jgi:hypothetical protein